MCSYSVYYQTHSHNQLTHTYPSSCWIPPSHSLNIFYFSQTQIQRICSFNETFKLHCNESTQAQYLNRRGYDLGLLSQEIQHVHTVCTIKHIHTSNSPTRIPRVVGYHPATRSISSIFHKHKYILSSSQLCATMFKYIPLITFLRTIKPEIH